MIPECLHYYGEEAAKARFSNAGLLAYKNVNWDPTKQLTTSHQDYATQALVEEDLFQTGSNWKMKAPIIQPQTNHDKWQAQQKNYTVENLLESRNTDTDVRSFGLVFGRNHDGDSIAIETNKAETDETTLTVIQIDPTLVINNKEDQDDMSFDAPSAGFTTGKPRAELHNEKVINAELLKENQVLAAMIIEQTDDYSVKTTKSTTDKLAEALEQITFMKKSQTDPQDESGMIISTDLNSQAPVNHELAGTETDSVGGKD
jgi:hypothetical protein